MKRLFYRLGLLMGLFGMLLGCDGDAPIKELPQQLLLESYLPSGELISQRILAPDDPVYQRLKSLLETQGGGWKGSFASYRPALFVLRDERIFIHCYADMMVIDVVQSGHSTSMQKSVPNLLQVLGLSSTKS
jgi:hypothetical protein